MISDTKFKNGVSDFRMFRKEMVDAIISLTENNRFSKGIFSWVGFKTKYMPYNVEERHAGKSNFNITKSFKYAWDGIVNFSNKPLRIATVIGSLTSIGAFIYLIIIIIKTINAEFTVPKIPILIVIIITAETIQNVRQRKMSNASSIASIMILRMTLKKVFMKP